MRSAVSESGGNASLAGSAGRVWRSLNGHEGESRTRPRRTSVAENIPEGRVSGAIRNPKGMRRSIGLQSMGATPKTNRSAKDGARSSPHYGGKGVLIHPSHQGVCWRHDTEDSRVTPGDLHGSGPQPGKRPL